MMAMTLTRLLMIAALLAMFGAASAQAQQQAQPAAASSQELLKVEELDQLVSPIALYPDTLLAEVLMASTYPLEVVAAERWATQNKNLKGEQLKAAADKQSWDESVKSLVATPEVLTIMSTKLDWTQKLGDAVLAQQADVMDAIQRLRTRAQANKKLTTTKEQKVTVKQEQGKQVIVIEPTAPDTIYVPYYDPAVVYGSWPYPAYPPYYYPAPGYVAGAVIATGVAFGVGYAVGRWATGGNYWGGGVNWGGNNINVNRPVNINTGNINNWTHNSEHRHGVRYNNTNVQQKFSKTNIGSGNQRLDFRGHSGEQVLKPGGDRPGAGDRKPGGDRPGAGTRDRPGGDRPSAGTRDRPGGDRPGAGTRDRPGGDRPSTGARDRPGGDRPGGANRPQRDTSFSNIQSKALTQAHANRGHASLGNRGAAAPHVGARGGAPRAGAAHTGGARAGGAARGGRRSDFRLKHAITLIGRLDNGLGFYRFVYNGGTTAYVGVMAQEVQTVMPDAVVRGPDGYLRVRYDKLGLRFETYDRWLSSGAQIPALASSGSIAVARR